MKAKRNGLNIARRRVELLRGNTIDIRVNEGRNRIIDFVGEIGETYEGIFTINDNSNDMVRSYPYSAILTGNIKFYRHKE